MEKTREFTVVNNNYLQRGNLVVVGNPDKVEKTFPTEADLSDKYDKAKNKVVYSAVFSILVGLYTFDTSSSIFGLKFEELTDRRMEWSVWFVTIFFFINATFRFFDERRRYEKYKIQVENFRHEFTKLNYELINTSKEVLRYLGFDFGIERKIGDVEKRLELVEGKISSHVGSKKAMELMELIEALNLQMVDVNETFKRMEVINKETSNKIIDLPSKIEDFQKRISPVKKFRNLGGIRFALFDVVAPTFLVLFATIIHLFPITRNVVLDMAPVSHITSSQENTI